MSFKKNFTRQFYNQLGFEPDYQKIKNRVIIEESQKEKVVVKRSKRFAIAIAALVVFVLSIVTTIGFISVGRSNIPTYTGMTIARLETVSNTARRVNDHSDHLDEVENNIEDIVKIESKTDEVEYYVSTNETFIIQVHLSNPKQYEIQSFTLNGEKYANYMFKEGSTMELLLLEVTAPSTPGYYEYTIDAIKYIDGTDIKDVRMKGDKTIKTGVAYESAPKAIVTSKEISTTYINLEIEIEDEDSLIGENPLDIYLSDGKEVVDVKDLHVGSNSITFNNLKNSTPYEYGIAATYDMVNGEGLHSEWLFTDKFSTLGAFSFANVEVSKESISFDIIKNVEIGSVEKVSLYDTKTNELVSVGDANTRKFDGLLSNHEYSLYIDFNYKSDIHEYSDWCVQKVMTEAYTKPTIEVFYIVTTDESIEGIYSLIDLDNIGNITSVELYEEASLVEESKNKEIKFTSLKYYTEYKILFTFTYDLNDGNGIIEDYFEYEVKTAPHLSLNSTKVLNANDIDAGETIFIQSTLDNPNKAMPTKVIVNGQEYSCEGSTVNMIMLNIVNEGQFGSGIVILRIEEVYMKLDGKEYNVSINAFNVCSVTILDTFKFISASFVNSKLEDIDWFFEKDASSINIMITLSNVGGYEVTRITGTKNVTKEMIKKLDNNHWYFKQDLYTIGYFTFETLYYEDNKGNTLSIDLDYKNIRTIVIQSDETKKISTPSDLKNVKGSYYYVLQNDIDLSGIEWKTPNFEGILEGNGYSIKNLSLVGKYSDQNFGLFNNVYGIIQNVIMDNILCVTDSSTWLHFGAFACYTGTETKIKNCIVNSNSYISLGNGGAGGIVRENYGIIENCINNATIISNWGSGGIAVANQGGKIINCTNNGAITCKPSEKDYTGGIVSHNFIGIVEGCTNNGKISCLNGSSGGIAGYNAGIIKKCTNYGEISAQGGKADGIVGERDKKYENDPSYNWKEDVIDCNNYGKIG